MGRAFNPSTPRNFRFEIKHLMDTSCYGLNNLFFFQRILKPYPQFAGPEVEEIRWFFFFLRSKEIGVSVSTLSFFFKYLLLRAREMVQWLRALAALAEDLSLVSNHSRELTDGSQPSVSQCLLLAWPLKAPSTHVVHRHIHR